MNFKIIWIALIAAIAVSCASSSMEKKKKDGTETKEKDRWYFHSVGRLGG